MVDVNEHIIFIRVGGRMFQRKQLPGLTPQEAATEAEKFQEQCLRNWCGRGPRPVVELYQLRWTGKRFTKGAA